MLTSSAGRTFYLVNATIFGCKQTLGMRAAVYNMAQKHFGQYFQTKEETFYYDNDDLKIHVVFDSKDNARGFRNPLSFWHLEQPLVMPRGKVMLEQDIQPVEAGNYCDILLSDYVAMDSGSPLTSLDHFRAAQASSTSSELPYFDALVQFQSLERMKLFHLFRPYKMHLKSQADFPKLRANHNNILSGSWQFHQLFDGMNLSENCPQVAIRICTETEMLRECVGEHRHQRYRIGLILEFRSTTAEDAVKLNLKLGSVQIRPLMWRSFVHVEDNDMFEQCLQWKYDQTKQIWSEYASDDI